MVCIDQIYTAYTRSSEVLILVFRTDHLLLWNVGGLRDSLLIAYLHSSLPDSRISLYKSQDLGICCSHSYQPSQYGTNTTRSFTYSPTMGFPKE